MKYLLALLLGIVTGAASVAVLLYFNPLAGGSGISPLAVSDQALMQLNYSGVAERSILTTNNGDSRIKPHPAKVLQLWEAPVRQSDARMILLRDVRGNAAGLGIKYSSRSESTNLLNAEAIADSVWHVVLPDRGTFFVQQSENYWDYLREVVIPAHLSSGDSWRGTWNGNMTAGPGVLGTAVVTGGSGEFEGRAAEAVESLRASAYSTSVGPVTLEGNLAIEFQAIDDILGEDTAIADSGDR